ncbi:hypothetical protein BH23ACT11_BH23ACT11_15410 [soil metagenome]
MRVQPLILIIFATTFMHCASSREGGESGSLDVLTARLQVAEPSQFAAEAWVERYEPVIVHSEIIAGDRPSVGDRLSLSIFGEHEVVAIVSAVDNVGSFRNIRAQEADGGQGDILLSVGNGQVAGTIQLYQPAKRFYIRYDESISRHVVMEVNPEEEDVLPGAPPLTAPPR